MAYVVPLIRAAAAMPLVRWLQAKGRPVHTLLTQADLEALPVSAPMRPIPLISTMRLLRLAGEMEGPDVGCRVLAETSALEILLLGKVAIGARTPREALSRIARALPYFCTHEHLVLRPVNGDINVQHFFAVKFDADTLHLIHQYVASMVRTLCAMAGNPQPHIHRLEIAPHPSHGIEHLRPWLGSNLFPGKHRTLSLLVDKQDLDRPFPARGRDRATALMSRDLIPLHGDGTYSSSVRLLIEAMLGDATPTVERLAASAGTSVRTFQRRLDAESTSFSALLDDVRRSRAVALLAGSEVAVGTISEELGYARQASLTRAVRRWTGQSPRRLRSDDSNP